MDKCVFDNLGIERPHLGYFSAPRVHETQRPKPIDPIAAREFKKAVSLDEAPKEVTRFSLYINPLCFLNRNEVIVLFIGNHWKRTWNVFT